MKCADPQCKRETSQGGLCDTCQANFDFYVSRMQPDLYDESKILLFLTTEADALQDMSCQEAELYDDVAQFGERELKSFELRLGSQMLTRYKALKRKERP